MHHIGTVYIDWGSFGNLNSDPSNPLLGMAAFVWDFAASSHGSKRSISRSRLFWCSVSYSLQRMHVGMHLNHWKQIQGHWGSVPCCGYTIVLTHILLWDSVLVLDSATTMLYIQVVYNTCISFTNPDPSCLLPQVCQPVTVNIDWQWPTFCYVTRVQFIIMNPSPLPWV